MSPPFGLDPLLAEAVLLLRASEYSGSGAWLNEGTAGAVLDATVAFVDGSVEKAAGFDGLESNAATCPDAADLDLTTGFCVAVDMDVDWQPALPQQILAKPRTGDATTDDCYAVGYDNAGHPFVEWYDTTDGHVTPSFITGNGATADVTFADGYARRQLVFEWLSTAQGYTARVYSGTPEAPTLLSEIVNTSVGAQTIEASTDGLRVADPVLGAVYRVRLYDSLGGTLLRDFYPDRDYVSGVTMTSGGPEAETWSNVMVTDDASFLTATVPDDAALDVAADADATWAFRFTQPNVANVDGEAFIVATRKTGAMGVDGDGFRLGDIKIAAFGLDFAGAVVGDGADQGFVVGAHWAAGEHTAVLTVDRATDIATLYIDGASHATADISAVGALDPAADLTLGSAFHHAAAKWDRALTPTEVAALGTLLA